MFGVLGRAAELKQSKSGKSILRLNVRTGDGDGGQWVSVMVFDEDAIACADKMVKGAQVYVEGRLEVNEWTGQDGAKRHGLSVMSWHCRLAQIGRHKPKRPSGDLDASDTSSPSANDAHGPRFAGRRDLDGSIPF
jgi:single-strand DNA-binding protein